jgi:Tfp pilus assembly ATPase PilU
VNATNAPIGSGYNTLVEMIIEDLTNNSFVRGATLPQNSLEHWRSCIKTSRSAGGNYEATSNYESTIATVVQQASDSEEIREINSRLDYMEKLIGLLLQAAKDKEAKLNPQPASESEDIIPL